MTIQNLDKPQKYVGLSTDDKTNYEQEGSIIYYTDTKQTEIYHNSAWDDYIDTTSLSGSLAKDGTTKNLSFTTDDDGEDILRVVDAAPFAYDETNEAKRTIPANADILARATDTIINTIGAENIALFLPMNEASGTKVYDLLRKDISFSLGGNPTLNQDTPFGKGISFGGSADYLIRDSLTQNTAGAAWLAMNDPAKKWASRLATFTASVGFIRLALKRTGTLGTATLRVTIYSESSSVPNAAITNGAATVLACSNIGTSEENRGLSYINIPTPSKSSRYWAVVDYADGTGVDANNYISWKYETGANTYGESRAVYDGAAWTVTAGENHVFGVWDNALVLPTDYSIIALVTNTAAITLTKDIFCQRGMTNLSALLRNDSSGRMALGAYDSDSRFAYGYNPSSTNFNVFAGTFSKTKDALKLNLYKNGLLTGSATGTATTAAELGAQPAVIGASITAAGALSSYWQGVIGTIILTKSELTAANVAIISHNLLALRKYGQSV